MMKYKIKNIDKFAKYIGRLVAKQSGFTSKEFKSYINISNIKNIIYNHAEKIDDGSIALNEKTTNIIYSEIFDWLVGVDLAKLAADDILDCYWDNKRNCMIFKNKE